MNLKLCSKIYRQQKRRHLKSADLSEEMKDILWKRVDRARVAWWNPTQKRIIPLYKAEGDAVVKAITGKTTADAMVKAAEKAINKLGPNWETELNRISTAVIEEFGQDTADDYAEPKSDTDVELKFEFDVTSVAIRAWVEKNGADLVKTIASTNLDEVRAVILAGVDEGASTAKIARNLRSFYVDRSPFKAMRIARTEITKASAFGNMEAAKQSGVVKTKGWLSSRDDRVRDEHEAIDGETVKLDDVFSNGLPYPSEPMCRCVLTFGTR